MKPYSKYVFKPETMFYSIWESVHILVEDI